MVNKKQEWYCKGCGRETVHEINNDYYGSEFVTLKENIRAYQCYRECTEEGCWGRSQDKDDWSIWTVEIKESDFDKLCSELDSLRDFREAVLKALEATDRKSETPGATVKTTDDLEAALIARQPV